MDENDEIIDFGNVETETKNRDMVTNLNSKLSNIISAYQDTQLVADGILFKVLYKAADRGVAESHPNKTRTIWYVQLF